MEPNNEIPRAEQIGKKVEIKIPEKPRLENPPQEKDPHAAEKLAEARQQLASEKTGAPDSKPDNIVPSDDATLKSLAIDRLEDYKTQRESYYQQERGKYFGEPKPETWKTRLATRLKPLKNITRMGGDLLRSFQSISERPTLQNAEVEATILGRDEILANPQFQALLNIPENKTELMNLCDRELFREVNCRNILMLEGLSPAQFHLLAKRMGGSPKAFLSDDRGENSGRYSADNILPADGKHPFVEADDPDYKAEKELWEPVFPDSSIPVIKNWRMSRTHSVVYAVKDAGGKDVLLMPIHVDPKNPVAAFRFGQDALKYHQSTGVEEVGKAKYVGTGLYDLGIKYFARHLRLAKEKGFIKEVNITGEDKLVTTNKITRDDQITNNINSIVSQSNR